MNRYSDQALAYAIFRLTFGVNIGFRGFVRIMNGLDGFTAGMLKQFSATWFPPPLLNVFGHTLPIVETALGILLVLGLWTRPALVIGGLMMTMLTFGTMFLGDFNLAWLQLTYAIAFFLLLAARSWNVISVDGMMRREAPAASKMPV